MNQTTVENYLRTYTNEPGPYDFNGLLHMVLAGVDNLRENHLDADLEDYACAISEEQARFLEKLLDYRRRFPEDIDA